MEQIEKYEAVPVAYELSLKSMESATKRFDAQDSNLDRVIGLVPTITVAVVAVLAKEHPVRADLHSWLMTAAVLLFVSSLVVAFVGKYRGDLIIIDPGRLFEDHLDQSEAEFKLDMIAYLGDNYAAAENATNMKWKFCIAASILFCLEIACLISWAVVGA